MLRFFVACALVVGTLLIALGVTARGQCPGGVCPAPGQQFAAPPAFYQGQQFAPPAYYEPSSYGVAAPFAGVREFREPMLSTGSIPYVIFCPCVSAPAPAPVSSYYQQQFYGQPAYYQPQQPFYGRRNERGVRVQVSGFRR